QRRVLVGQGIVKRTADPEAFGLARLVLDERDAPERIEGEEAPVVGVQDERFRQSGADGVVMVEGSTQTVDVLGKELRAERLAGHEGAGSSKLFTRSVRRPLDCNVVHPGRGATETAATIASRRLSASEHQAGPVSRTIRAPGMPATTSSQPSSNST